MVCIVLMLLLVGLACCEAELWNATTDPLPPPQPAEVGMQTLQTQSYTYANNGSVFFDLTVSGYQFSSYANQIIIAFSAGQNAGSPPAPLMQYAYNNFASGENMLAGYDTQTCAYGEVEGNVPFPGYDYYSNYLLLLYDMGVPITFENVTLPELGVCLRYSAPVPWNNPQLPRNLTYTLTFQNSTGYLIEYQLHGTEYCCPDMFCPNSGLCPDGSAPQLIIANTDQQLYGYQVFSNASWPSGFFDAYCPFGDGSSSSRSDGLAEVLMWVFAGLLVLMVVLVIWMACRMNRMNVQLSALKAAVSSAEKESAQSGMHALP